MTISFFLKIERIIFIQRNLITNKINKEVKVKKNQKISSEKLSISDCKKILSTKGREYSENEIISIRDLLYCFAQIDIDTFYQIEQRENEFSNERTASEKENVEMTDNDLKNVA